jgi:hypothetical protein
MHGGRVGVNNGVSDSLSVSMQLFSLGVYKDLSLAVGIMMFSRNASLVAPSPQAKKNLWAVEKVRIFPKVRAESF